MNPSYLRVRRPLEGNVAKLSPAPLASHSVLSHQIEAPEKGQRAMAAMLKMKKIDIAAVERATTG